MGIRWTSLLIPPRSAKFDLYVDEVYKVPAALVCLLATHIIYQGSACSMSDSAGLVDFAITRVIFVLNLPNRQVLFSGGIQITEGL